MRARAKALVTAERDMLGELVQARKKHGLTQKEVAERMGVSQSAVSQIERYDANPTLATLRRYALAVEVRLQFQVTSDRDFGSAAAPSASETTRLRTT